MKKIRGKKVVLMGILLFVIYFMAGLLLPFCRPKMVGEEYQWKVLDREYLGQEGQGTDRACIVETAVEALEVRLQMLDFAKEDIVLATFDMRDCESTRDIAAVLLQAADRGVKVKLLVDGVSGLLRMRKPIFKLLGSHENIEIRLYNEPNLLFPWTLNGRMHDKYIMVDGTYLLMGGRNTFDYFLGAYTDKNLSLDREVFFVSDIQIENSAIAQMEEYYKLVWEQDVCKALYDKEKYGQGSKEQKLREELDNRYKDLERTVLKEVEGISFVENTVPVEKATLLYNPVSIMGKEPWVFYELTKLMGQAKERVYIHTPYAVCNDYMYKELANIALEVPEVIIQLNTISNGDNVCASADYIYNKKRLLACDMTIYEYDGGDSSHGKSVLIDDRLSVIGSFNFDMRSAYIDTELMFVIDSRELNQDLEKKLLALEQDSIKVLSEEEYMVPFEHKRTELKKGKEIFLKLFGFLVQPFRFLL